MGSSSWIAFALIYSLFMAAVNILDKWILDRWARHPLVPVMLIGLFNLPPLVLILLLRGGFPALSAATAILILAAGIALFFMVGAYFYAASQEEISRVVPLLFLGPLFVSVLAAVFLGEVFPAFKYLGVASLILGAVLISIRLPLGIPVNRAFWWMLFAAASMSVHLVLVKHLLTIMGFWSVFALTRLGMTAAVLPVFLFRFRALKDAVRNRGARGVWIMAVDQNLALAASLFITIAAAYGPITLVNALTSVQPFLVLLIALLLSRFAPHWLQEETRRSTVVQKLAALTLMIIGVLVIT